MNCFKNSILKPAGVWIFVRPREDFLLEVRQETHLNLSFFFNVYLIRKHQNEGSFVSYLLLEVIRISGLIHDSNLKYSKEKDLISY